MDMRLLNDWMPVQDALRQEGELGWGKMVPGSLQYYYKDFDGFPDVDVVIDCSAFEKTASVNGHCGEHTDIIVGVVQHRSFTEILGKAKSAIMAKSETNQVITVVMTCPRGVKRSVVFARLLAECLRFGDQFIFLRSQGTRQSKNGSSIALGARIARLTRCSPRRRKHSSGRPRSLICCEEAKAYIARLAVCVHKEAYDCKGTSLAI